MFRTKPNGSDASPNTVAKVLIVDDHPTVREGLASRISRQADLEVCGEAADIAEALHLVETTRPDVVVVDISLKTGNGIDLIKRIKAPRPVDSNAGVFDVFRFVVRGASPPGRRSGIHQQREYDRSDSRRDSSGSRRGNLLER